MRPAHWIGFVIAAALILHGLMALRAAERSAAHGGGLLGGYGLMPLALGILLCIATVVSLIIGRKSP